MASNEPEILCTTPLISPIVPEKSPLEIVPSKFSVADQTRRGKVFMFTDTSNIRRISIHTMHN